MLSSPQRPALPTQIVPTVGARLTLPASTSEESVRGSGRQVRILRAPSLAVLQEIVTRELRAFAMTFIGDSKSSRKRGDAATGAISNAAIAGSVIAALDAGDFHGAVIAHATGFGLGVVLPPQLGGEIGDSFELPAPGSRKKRTPTLAGGMPVVEDEEQDTTDAPDDVDEPVVRHAA